MRSEIPEKRRRGGQPGNRNAAGNRGNPRPRRNVGNRGGGAPAGNQNARRWPRPGVECLLREYGDSPEAVAWLREHAAELRDSLFTGDDQRDPALYAAFLGSTPEELAAGGREFKLGLYTLPWEGGTDEEA